MYVCEVHVLAMRVLNIRNCCYKVLSHYQVRMKDCENAIRDKTKSLIHFHNTGDVGFVLWENSEHWGTANFFDCFEMLSILCGLHSV